MAGFSWIRAQIIDTEGSTPREIGATLWVSANEIRGSVGGGNYENATLHHARQMIAEQRRTDTLIFTLGVDAGQCCGGRVEIKLEAANPPEHQTTTLAIFGAGHIGAQISRLAEALDFDTRLYDTRAKIELPRPKPYTRPAIPEAEIDKLKAGDIVLILTHDHGLDFLLAAHALERADLGFVGMIGSKTKAARFRSQYKALGDKLGALHSPIAKTDDDKRPEAIALDILREVLHHIAK